MKQYVNDCLDDPVLDVLNTLNQLPQEYPDAISLASGRPSDDFCQPQLTLPAISTFSKYASSHSRNTPNRLLGQYANTSGIINELLAKHLEFDENIIGLKSDNIIITVGFQEAAAISVMGLFQKNDVLIIPDPVFIGISGIAKICNVMLESIPFDANENIEEYIKVIQRLKENGKNPKAIYVIPDFSNPQGTCMPLSIRKKLLTIAANNNMFILEDNAYSQFRYNGTKIPSLKSLDNENRVVYLGSFAKTLFPGLRIGYLVAEATVIKELTKVKSFLTVNTPGITQGIVGGILLENNYSLKKIMIPKLEYCKHNRDVILATLDKLFSKECKEYSLISWNKPEGGFFITLTLPFPFDLQEAKLCAKEYGVIVFPIASFSLLNRSKNSVRLAFTNVGPEKLRLAVERFGQYISKKIQEISRNNKSSYSSIFLNQSSEKTTKIDAKSKIGQNNATFVRSSL